jgi:hypothetical protein
MISLSAVFLLLQEVDIRPTVLQLHPWMLKFLTLIIHEQDGEAPWTTHSSGISLIVTTVLLQEVIVISTMKPPVKFLPNQVKEVGVDPSTRLQAALLLQQVDTIRTTKPLPRLVLKFLLYIREQGGEALWTTHLLDCRLISSE